MRKKSFWFWMYFVIAIILAVYFATKIIMIIGGHGPTSVVKSISISSPDGKRNLTSIATSVGIASGTHTYSVNLDDVNARISRVPDVKTSAVRRLPNGNLSVSVRLYRAVAAWTDGENYYPLSDDGTIIKRQMDALPENTVVFRGPIPGDITEITKLVSSITPNLEFMEWIEDRRWNIYTKDDLTIMLPEDNPTAAISALSLLDKNHHILSKKIKVLDMRDSARILVK